MVMHRRKVTQSWTSSLFSRQIFGEKCKLSLKGPFKACRLISIVPNYLALKDVFLGFSVDGNFIFSYTCNSSNAVDHSEFTCSYTYKLNVWSFVPNRKLKRVCSVKLFGDASIPDELYLIFAQFPNLPQNLLIVGHHANVALTTEAKKCWTSSVAYFQTISLAHLFGKSSCSKFEFSETDDEEDEFETLSSGIIGNNVDLVHALSFEFSFPATISSSMMLICLLPSDICVVNSGTNLFAFRLTENSTEDIEQKSDQTQTESLHFLHSRGHCLKCGKSDMIKHCSWTCFEVEQCLQHFCESFCQLENIVYVGFRDYESYVIEDYVENDTVFCLLGVLMEIESDNMYYWETYFLISWNLRTNKAVADDYNTVTVQKRLKTDVNLHGWDRMEGIKQEIAAQKFKRHKNVPHLFTNQSVLKRQSVKSICDSEKMLAVIL